MPKPNRREKTDRSRAAAWVALVIAVYGAALSTVQLLDSRAEKARLLDVTPDFHAAMAPGAKRLPIGLELKAVNDGQQVVSVNAAGIFLPDGQRLDCPQGEGDWQFPCDVAPGRSKSYLFWGQALADLCAFLRQHGFADTVTLVGFYEDEAGGPRHRSDPFEFDIGKALAVARAQIDEAVPESAEGTVTSKDSEQQGTSRFRSE